MTGLFYRHPELVSGSEEWIPKQVRNDIPFLSFCKSPSTGGMDLSLPYKRKSLITKVTGLTV
jgi:hypothetical protein